MSIRETSIQCCRPLSYSASGQTDGCAGRLRESISPASCFRYVSLKQLNRIPGDLFPIRIPKRGGDRPRKIRVAAQRHDVSPTERRLDRCAMFGCVFRSFSFWVSSNSSGCFSEIFESHFIHETLDASTVLFPHAHVSRYLYNCNVFFYVRCFCKSEFLTSDLYGDIVGCFREIY